jgi:hypothetical protein
MKADQEFATSREGRLQRAVAVMRRRLREERELLLAPRLELVPLRHAVRGHGRLEATRRQLR